MTSQTSRTGADADGLCSFVDSSPSPFHVCATVATELTAGGFVEVHETQSWPAEPGRYFLVRGGSLIAWSTEGVGNAAPFRIVGGHTDSPNLRVKQHPDLTSAGWQMVGLEPYGGAWLNSWLDRDLGISGRLSVRVGNTVEQKLVRIDDPDSSCSAAGYPPVRRSQGCDAGSAEARQRNLGRGFEAQVVHRLCRRACGCSRVVGSRLGIDDTRPCAPAQSWGWTRNGQRPQARQSGHVFMQGHKHFWPRLSRPVSRSQCLLSSIMKRSAACPIAELSRTC